MQSICQVKKPVIRSEWKTGEVRTHPTLLPAKSLGRDVGTPPSCFGILLGYIFSGHCHRSPSWSTLPKDLISVQPSVNYTPSRFMPTQCHSEPLALHWTLLYSHWNTSRLLNLDMICVIHLDSVTTSFTVLICPPLLHLLIALVDRPLLGNHSHVCPWIYHLHKNIPASTRTLFSQVY